MNLEDRLMDIEMALANQQRVIDDLNEVVIKQGKLIDNLTKENRLLIGLVKDGNIKPLNEETPPPHY